MKNDNYIIGEINIKESEINKYIRIINSFEKVKRERKYLDNKFDYEYENEKEIKEKCKIEINNKEIQFNYYYKFKEKGKYKIKYSFINNIDKTDFMFYECRYLTNINLSNFNTKNDIDIYGMFS